MLFQPSNIYPSTLSGIGAGTVDVTQGLNVSWQVNGDTPMTAYQIKIYQNDTASTLKYDSGSVSVSPAFETHDRYGNPTFYTVLLSAATLSTAGIVNGYQYGYKMLITQWWGVSDYVEQTSASVFITRSLPTISIDAIPNPVTSSSLTITATYAQAQGDPISTVDWVFALAGSESNPIKNTGAVNTQVLSFDADGLINGNTYSIMCTVVTANGMEASTGFVQFTVSYSSSSLGINYQLAQLKNSSAVYLSWDDLGSNVLSYPYTDSTKTTNGITFTVNGEGDVVASGTANADAYFTIAQGTLSQLGITAGQKFIVTSGYSGAKIVVTETNSSNVVVSTIEGSDPLQYIATSTTNTLKFSIVIPSGSVLSSGQQLKPMIALEDKIVAYNDLSANIEPIQDLNGYSSPWPAGGGKNKLNPLATYKGCSYNAAVGTTLNPVAADKSWQDAGDDTFTISNLGSWSQACLISDPLPLGKAYVKISNVIGAIRCSVYVCNGDFKVNRVLYNSNPVPEGDTIVVNTTFTNNDTYFVVYLSGNGADASIQYPYVYSGYTAATDSFSPYSNICPISGRTGVSVYVSPTQDPDDATTYSVDWTSQAGTVYGGALDVVTGLLTVTHAIIEYDGSSDESWGVYSVPRFYINRADFTAPGNLVVADIKTNRLQVIAKSSMGSINYRFSASDSGSHQFMIRVDSSVNTVALLRTWLSNNPLQVVYKLTTPLTYQLTPQDVAALVTNNVWTNAGDVTVSYTTDTGSQATISGPIVSFSNTNAQNIPTPQFIPGITGLSIYRYLQGELALQHVYDLATGATSILDYFAPSQTRVSYLLVAHSNVGDLFLQTNDFVPTFWFYSVLLCDTDSNGNYHVSKEYIFKYGVETGAISNNNGPTIQKNFTPYPNRQPISSLYKTGKLSGYIGKTNNLNQYSDTISLQNAIFEISTSSLTKFIKSRKGDILMADTAAPIQMQTEDNTTEQALKATIDWVEVGDADQVSIVSISTDPFWPLP